MKWLAHGVAACIVCAAGEPERTGIGTFSGSARYRYEIFSRQGPQFPHASHATTARLSVGYQSPAFHGFSGFVEGEGVFALGPRDYSIPTVPGRNRPGYPAILDPLGVEWNQAFLRWSRERERWKLRLTAGRQEILLNDGRFVSISTWRQNHQSYDALQLNASWRRGFSVSYAFIDRFHRVTGGRATDGRPKMNTHLADVVWKKSKRMNLSVYTLLLDYAEPSLAALSTKTFGVRLGGPHRLDEEWDLLYTAEFAGQRRSGANPNRVNANYYLAELGAARSAASFKAGCALLGGRSAVDKLTTPLAHPFNGWTEMFAGNPSLGSSHGLRARYFTASAAVPCFRRLTASSTFYDYHSDSKRIHYGRELDAALAWRMGPAESPWEIGWRMGRYWADRLFTSSLRASAYTSFMF